MGWMDVQKGISWVTWARETHRLIALPRLGQAIPANPRRSASAASSRIAARFPDVAMRDRAGRSGAGMAPDRSQPTVDGEGLGAGGAPGVRSWGAHRLGLPVQPDRAGRRPGAGARAGAGAAVDGPRGAGAGALRRSSTRDVRHPPGQLDP